MGLDSDCFYFETKIKTLHDRKMTLIGFSSRLSAKQRAAEISNPLGHTQQASYGLRADGILFKKGAKAQPSESSGSRFTTVSGAYDGFRQGDIIGCGLLLQKKTIFFTHNGSYLGEAFMEVDLGLQD